MSFRRTRRQPPHITEVPTPAEESIDQPADYVASEPDLSLAPIVPEEATPPAIALAPVQDDPGEVRVSIRQRRSGLNLNRGVVFAILILVIAGIFGGLARRGLLPSVVLSGWPLIVVLGAAIWFFRALGRRSGAGLLGSTALIGISMSLALATAGGIPFGQSWIGLTFITIGIGTLLRGLLWRMA